MNKREFVVSLAEEKEIMKEDASKLAEMVFGHLRSQLLKGNEVRIDDLGVFKIKYRKPTIMNNNITGTKHDVGPRIRIKFRVFNSMQRVLNATLAKQLAEEYEEDADE
jgi:nucleoid DNA-binding protein